MRRSQGSGRISSLWERWHDYNARFFGGKLCPPHAIRITSARRYDGYLHYKVDPPWVRICLSTHQPWFQMLGTLLHEMVHQYQVEVLGVYPDHGPTFRPMAKWIERTTGLELRVTRLI